MTRMSTRLQFSLPDPANQWPWPRMLNSHYQKIKPQSDSWIRGFEVLDAKSQKSFDLCNFREWLLYPFIRPVAEEIS
jgi:Delta6-protoilludene synthase